MCPAPDTDRRTAADAETDRLLVEGWRAMQEGRLEAAGRAAEAASRLTPGREEPWDLLCAALEQAGASDAPRAMAKAISNFPESHPFRTGLEARRAAALIHRNLVREGVEQARLAASRHPIPATAHQLLAGAFRKAGLYKEALHHAERAVEALQGDSRALYDLATVYRFMGRFDEAGSIYDQSLETASDPSFVYAALATMRKWTPETNHIAGLRDGARRAQPGSEGAARLHYALFKELDDVGRHDEAWEALTTASAIVSARGRFPERERQARAAAIIEAFPKARLAAPSPASSSRPRPIFIVGLPRSGTTLVERILSAHSRVTALGETTAMGRAVSAAAGDPAEIAELYRRHTGYLAGDAEVVTDKLPNNYEHIGHIRTAFPDAAIVHVRRSPMDSLFGAYRLQFGENAFWWSYSLDGLAANYRIYRRLTDHWREVLGETFFEITLEALIADPPAQIRRLLQAAGLGFEEACLYPEQSEGGVSTASASQIRRPINSQGVGAWRRYARQLEPLRAELERDGFVDGNGEPL